MTSPAPDHANRQSYNPDECEIGIVHLGYGAFHRAHQAVFIDRYMRQTNDLRWGIAAVNLRENEAASFARENGKAKAYVVKTTSPDGVDDFQVVNAHVTFSDWSSEPASTEQLLALDSVHMVTITVTESGYYLDETGKSLDLNEPLIASEIGRARPRSVYGYLANALEQRMVTCASPLTILCCDNIRSNGEMLERCLLTYLERLGKNDLAEWVRVNVRFPCSMVDRITPRADRELATEIEGLFSADLQSPVKSEDFIQWVIEDNFAGPMPALGAVGVEVVDDVDPYEEAKIRILNGGHSGLCYLGALAGYKTFDAAMNDLQLQQHFNKWQFDNILPGLAIELPFDKVAYVKSIALRFGNQAIADSLERICMDGWAKMPIYIRPTLQSCLAQGIVPQAGYECVASWFVFARRYGQGAMHIEYHEPNWDKLRPLLAHGREIDFAQSEALWGQLPNSYKDFAPGIVAAIKEMEDAWPA